MAKLLTAIVAACHRAAFNILFSVRARNWREALHRDRPIFSSILVTGFHNEPFGIGRAGWLTLEALRRSFSHVYSEDLGPLQRHLLTRKPEAFSKGKPSVWLIHANPPEAKIALYAHCAEEWRSIYRIGYWVWESSIAPLSWSFAAKWFHEIWVPSQFVFDALSRAFAITGRSVYSEKLRIMPHPVMLPDIRRTLSPRPKVTVLTLFDPRSDFDRKNPFAAIAAWVEAFPEPVEHIRLIVKSYEAAKAYPQYRVLRQMAQGRTDVQFCLSTLSSSEMADLITKCDILISLHRGEGFGLSLAEAMAAELCVIATGWSGNLQFMSPENSFLVPVDLRPANQRYNGPLALWAEPDKTIAAAGLRLLAADENLRIQMGAQARRDVERLRDFWPATQFHSKSDS